MVVNKKLVDIDTKIERYNDLKSTRNKYIPTLEEAAKYSWPNAQDMVKDGDITTGIVRTINIYDSTSIRASYKMTAGIFTNLMPTGTRWFIFKPSNEKLLEDNNVKIWFSKATDICLSEIWRSNFQRQMFSTIRSMVVLGTGCISVTLTSENDLLFKSHHISDIFFDIDSKGRVDTVFRRIYYTARQARQEFPDGNLGDSIEKELKENKNQNKKFEFVHCVYSRNDYDPKKKLSKTSKKFVSEYINITDKVIVKNDKGYNNMPYMIGRFDITQDELMGNAPGIDLLPEIKMLQEMKKDYILGSNLNVLPTMMCEDDGVVGQPITESNAVMYIRSGAQFPKPYQSGANLQQAMADIQEQRQVIKDGYFVDLFQVLGDRVNISSAREVDQLASDSFAMLAPFVGGVNQEISDPMISNIMDLMIESGKIQPLETVIGQEIDYDITYQGRLAVAMSAMQANAIEIVLSKWSPLQALYPVLDNFDIDGACIDSAIATGFPASRIKDSQVVVDERTARAEAAAQQQKVELAETMSKAYKNTSVPAQPNSLAETMAGAL
jgi:hypothetical protein